MTDVDIQPAQALSLKLEYVHEYDGVDHHHHRCETWVLSGGESELDPKWRVGFLGDVSCRFRLDVIDGVVDPRLPSFGGNYWPSAWPRLFQPIRKGMLDAGLGITTEGLLLRMATLTGGIR